MLFLLPCFRSSIQPGAYLYHLQHHPSLLPLDQGAACRRQGKALVRDQDTLEDPGLTKGDLPGRPDPQEIMEEESLAGLHAYELCPWVVPAYRGREPGIQDLPWFSYQCPVLSDFSQVFHP